eukprot:CAMPEP_0196589548 /NCGR_PEP_ID=MMETSP1081-20130531/63889_1 /TAXON_ID=36882 /ORGANISM="Pyramimonas amylifera, Strain CCMP720" /LENGTH=178 /DNA_ID=CAMNT_0041912387 /DNA_START=113 /DNA_END=649 /DNA_ORIENTATION=+
MGAQPLCHPVDLAWKEIKDLADVVDKTVGPSEGAPNKSAKKEHNTSILLGSNEITTLELLPRVIERFFCSFEQLQWLDVSHNKLTTIEPVILQMTHLRILYLHGNEITKLKEVDKLSGLQRLKKLTLHANPIEEIKNYRNHVFTVFPQLQILDFIKMTKVDRDRAQTWDKLKFKPVYL